MPKLPLKFETASKYAYLLVALGAFASVIIASHWAYAHWGPIGFALVLCGGVVGAGILGSLGAEGLGAYWKRRRVDILLAEVDRLRKAYPAPPAPPAPGAQLYAEARKEIRDWEDQRHD